ncbi:MAG TPA: septal ring lytic transglycosylase RlpA family protein [Chromatiales bacterium]|nr:septal ring lytic transglycosylase RlpA family protein [Thiotrichales bacterium]HIP68574.1 septal ring lytic transglycosylase RlpA family protein [Chromatiales bacterium]
MKVYQLLLVLALLLLIQSCGLLQQKDRAGRELSEAEIAAIQDAVPVNEVLAKSGNPQSYEVNGRTYHVMKNAQGFVQHGKASWYGKKFHGRRTSSGETYDMYKMTAAHKTLPLPTYVRVTNLENQRSVVLKVNDRGPFVTGRAIDLSYVAARKLGIVGDGTANVEIRALEPGQTNHSEVVMSTVEDMQPLDTIPVTETLPVNTPVDPVAKTTPTKPPVSDTGIFLQVGAFSLMNNAERLRLRMEDMQSHPVNTITSRTAKGELHKVRIGPFSSDAELKKIQNLLRGKGHRQFRKVGI